MTYNLRKHAEHKINLDDPCCCTISSLIFFYEALLKLLKHRYLSSHKGGSKQKGILSKRESFTLSNAIHSSKYKFKHKAISLSTSKQIAMYVFTSIIKDMCYYKEFRHWHWIKPHLLRPLQGIIRGERKEKPKQAARGGSRIEMHLVFSFSSITPSFRTAFSFNKKSYKCGKAGHPPSKCNKEKFNVASHLHLGLRFLEQKELQMWQS
ncbi:hypothetical protein L7F22_066604 [Adiantum nelumboides]|nr:hypothetical protein [Adiantum nelumboides]